jgi:hypothetical protein
MMTAGNEQHSKKQNKLISTEEEINKSTNIPLGPNDASHRLGPPCVLSVAVRRFWGRCSGCHGWVDRRVGRSSVVGHWWSWEPIRKVVPLCFHMTKRSMRSHWLYKPSPNESFFPGHVPFYFIMLDIVNINSMYVSIHSFSDCNFKYIWHYM